MPDEPKKTLLFSLLVVVASIFLTVRTAAQQSPCTVTQVLTPAEWQLQFPNLKYQGTADTKSIITLKCGENVIDLPDDHWTSFKQDEVEVRVSDEAYRKMVATSDIQPFKEMVGNGISGSLPWRIFIRWLDGDVAHEVRSHVYIAFTGCPWGRPGEFDPRQCMGRERETVQPKEQ